MEAGFNIGNRALTRPLHLWTAGIAFLSIFIFKFLFPHCLGWRACGMGVARTEPEVFTLSNTNQDEDPRKKAIHQKVPPFSRKCAVLVFLGLWLIPFLVLIMLSSSNSLFLQIYLFFTQAAFVTFGEAYAVLAFVSQSAIDSYGWLTHGPMMDGFALAETTPGPLIMVLQFVGFMAGWNEPRNLGQVNSAILAALVTTYSTFLPCFLFIFFGAPYIERLRGNRKVSGALSTITATVVGVILNLALVLAYSVFWPHGLDGEFNGMALALSLAAFVALYRLKWNILWVLSLGGLLGLGLTLGNL
jgi:chromate transporter